MRCNIGAIEPHKAVTIQATLQQQEPVLQLLSVHLKLSRELFVSEQFVPTNQ